jgi:hypothetical protein
MHEFAPKMSNIIDPPKHFQPVDYSTNELTEKDITLTSHQLTLWISILYLLGSNMKHGDQA